jgi:hypothetical protein
VGFRGFWWKARFWVAGVVFCLTEGVVLWVWRCGRGEVIVIGVFSGALGFLGGLD